MKFGGTSVADAASISRVTDIIRQYHANGNEVAVVISAQRGVTDQLIAVATDVVNSPDSSMVGPFIESLRVRHMKALEGSAKDYVAEVAPLIEDRLEKLENILSCGSQPEGPHPEVEGLYHHLWRTPQFTRGECSLPAAGDPVNSP